MTAAKRLTICALAFALTWLASCAFIFPGLLPTSIRNSSEGVPLEGWFAVNLLLFGGVAIQAMLIGIPVTALVFLISLLEPRSTTAIWVVRENPIQREEWLSFCMSEQLKSEACGEWYSSVPESLPEQYYPQPGIRFFPVTSSSGKMARKAAKAMAGYVQER